ncbi:DUF4827 domain-containing protein [uncultured Bacteroides sp.]|uniref:DUF4827 domain-containing protein n=1 Tax=uncultured Bacteroides sp. TaxID=162156 RepID=UPI0025DA8451|nr:DUF4827 domain-containing protein [uncultured Bacteroides sp.]
MKKLVFLFLSLLTIGSLFQACDNSKTYAEMLEDEKNAVEKFIRDSAIQVISVEEFERNDTVTNLDRNEYVFFSSEGVYMQIVDRGKDEVEPSEEEPKTEAELNEAAKFVDGNIICTRYVERNVDTRELTAFNVPLPEFMDYDTYYAYPLVFRYVKKETYSAGTFLEMDVLWGSVYQTTAVPQGWLLALPYLRDNAHVRLIVPSKMGHQAAQQNVTPFYYDIREFRKARS